MTRGGKNESIRSIDAAAAAATAAAAAAQRPL